MTPKERFDDAFERGREAVDRGRDAGREAALRGRETLERGREAVVETMRGAQVKPRLRGVFHKWGFFGALTAGAVLVIAAPDGKATLAAAIYAASLAALLGTSAVYHRVDWKRPSARLWMRRLDHSMIFLLIAGTVTPFAVLVMEGPFANALLIAVWAAAAAGIVVELIWVEAPKWVAVLVYVLVGWIGALGFPGIVIEAGLGAGALIALGGLLYTTGAVIYARQSPDPRPATFGYHEIFHVLVLVAAAAHFAAVAIYAVPAA